MNEMPEQNPDKQNWLDDPKNVAKLFWGVIAAAVILFAADAVYHKHVQLAAESIFGFYGIFGFVVCVALVLIAKGLQKILMRDEDYYDR